MFAGELIYAPEADLRRADLLPADFPEPEPEELAPHAAGELLVPAPEPLLAVARPVGAPTAQAIVPYEAEDEIDAEDDPEQVAGIHMPLASISPLVLGLGFCIAMLGLISSPLIILVGLLWMLAGAIGWVRIGMLELGAAHARDHGSEH
jgi:hypothetical protein